MSSKVIDIHKQDRLRAKHLNVPFDVFMRRKRLLMDQVRESENEKTIKGHIASVQK